VIVSPTGEVKRRLFTVDDYYRMAEAGILTEDDRVELIEGEVVELPPIGNRHAGRVNRLTELLVRTLGERGVVAVQNPVRLNEVSEPQPDLAVLERREDFYADSHPGPGDVHLIIEISDPSSLYDRGVKAALYARTGIPELWIVDVGGEVFNVLREPSPDGYRSVIDYRRGDLLSPLAFPDMRLAVDQIL